MSNHTVPSEVKASRRRKAIAAVEGAAIAGGRCPTNDQLDYPLPDLAREGLFFIEVYAKNFRVATILKGEHAGKHTALPPKKCRKPYLKIGAGMSAPERPPEKPVKAPTIHVPAVPTIQELSEWTVGADGSLTRTNTGR